MFDFDVKLVIVMPSYGITDKVYGNVSAYYFLCAIKGVTSDYTDSYRRSRYYTWNINKLSWYSDKNDVGQCNISNTTYYWVGL